MCFIPAQADGQPESANSTIAQVAPTPGGGDPPREASPPPGPDSAPPPPDPLAILAIAAERLQAALDAGDIPPGTIPNVLSSFAKVSIAQAEIAASLPEPQRTAQIAHLERTTHEAANAVQAAFVGLLELTEQARDVLADLDQALASLTCPFSTRVRTAIRWAYARGPDPPPNVIGTLDDLRAAEAAGDSTPPTQTD